MSGRQTPVSTWSVQDAKAKFSTLLAACLAEGPQLVSRRGTEVAVLAPLAEWRRLEAQAGKDLKSLLLADEARSDDLIPPRRALR